MCTDNHLFDELTISWGKANKFDNATGDFNKDITKEDCLGFNRLEEFW